MMSKPSWRIHVSSISFFTSFNSDSQSWSPLTSEGIFTGWIWYKIERIQLKLILKKKRKGKEKRRRNESTEQIKVPSQEPPSHLFYGEEPLGHVRHSQHHFSPWDLVQFILQLLLPALTLIAGFSLSAHFQIVSSLTSAASFFYFSPPYCNFSIIWMIFEEFILIQAVHVSKYSLIKWMKYQQWCKW